MNSKRASTSVLPCHRNTAPLPTTRLHQQHWPLNIHLGYVSNCHATPLGCGPSYSTAESKAQENERRLACRPDEHPNSTASATTTHPYHPVSSTRNHALHPRPTPPPSGRLRRLPHAHVASPPEQRHTATGRASKNRQSTHGLHTRRTLPSHRLISPHVRATPLAFEHTQPPDDFSNTALGARLLATDQGNGFILTP